MGDRDVARVAAVVRERLGDAAFEQAYAKVSGRGGAFGRDDLPAVIGPDGPPRTR